MPENQIRAKKRSVFLRFSRWCILLTKGES